MADTHAASAVPTLVTSLVRLRPIGADDEATLRAILATPAVSQWWHPPEDGFPFDHEAGTVRWAVELLGPPGPGPAGAVVGMVQAYEGDDPDYDESGIDIFLTPSMHRRGLGRDVVTTVRDWLVDIRGHHLVTIDPAASNTAAIACYTACGFQPVGILHGRERSTDRRGWHDTLLMQYCAWWFDAGSASHRP
ncbi:GNAT family N-acetyltransferase [Longivirga aurantiaca]|uniref:GNAT family N-acetyltransferase n=1 Tax=Longivirga aurantiaca TaxID=1837743 RepID=A0ABW1SXS0_9ACTN